MTDTVRYTTGAVRSGDAEATRYDLVPLAGWKRVAEAAKFGSKKYSPHNWLKGMPVSDLLNHALAHIQQYLAGDQSEDHLGHAAWNVMAACEMEQRPDQMDIPTRTTKPAEPAHAVTDWKAQVPEEWGATST